MFTEAVGQHDGERRAVLALCGLAATVPLAFSVALSEPYLTPKWALTAVGATSAITLWLTGPGPKVFALPRAATWVPLAVLLLAGVASCAWSREPALSWESFRRGLPQYLLFMVALSVMRAPQARSMLASTLIAAGTFEAVYVLTQFFFGDLLFDAGSLHGKWRTFGTLGNPNWAGEFLAVSSLVSAACLKQTPWAKIALAVNVSALACTVARGAWIGCVLGGLGLLAVRRGKHLGLRTWILSAGIVICVAIVGVLCVWLLGDTPTLAHLTNLRSLRGRVWIWAVAWTMIRESVWLGNGLGTFGLLFPTYQGEAFRLPWAQQFVPNASFTSMAHNDFLQLWAEVGILGPVALAALGWFGLLTGRGLKDDWAAQGCWPAWVALLVNTMIASPLELPLSSMLFFLLLATVEAASAPRLITLVQPTRTARLGAGLLGAVLCVAASWDSFRMVSADYAMQEAASALVRRRWDEAGVAVSTAIACAPLRREGYLLRGRLLLARGQSEAAIKAFDQSLKLGPDPDTYEQKASALAGLNRFEEAVATLDQLAWLRPDLCWPRERASAWRRAAPQH